MGFKGRNKCSNIELLVKDKDKEKDDKNAKDKE